MNSLDRFMEFLLSAAFLCFGLAKIFSYNGRAQAPSGEDVPGETTGLMGLSYQWAALIGFFETAAALILLLPSEAHPAIAPALVAATALAVLMIGASFYRARQQQSAAPTIVLFLMALFVIAAHCL
ncbi:MAG TPA: DoxX family protein [Terracidiphilus sp.]|nr:DoxX family protein [Terracidiphilus sp.]